MNESSGQCSMTSSQELAILCQCVLRTTSLALVQRAGSSDADAATTLFFAGRTTSAHLPVLLRVSRIRESHLGPCATRDAALVMCFSVCIHLCLLDGGQLLFFDHL